ncbi:MAG TPA: hypothetical protein VGA70_02050, partial [Longimicrobiales bacterium]
MPATHLRPAAGRQGPAARIAKGGPPVDEGDAEAVLVDSAVMEAAEQHEIVEPSGAAIGPVADVMGVGEAEAAAWKGAATVPGFERAANGGRNRAGASADVENGAVAMGRGAGRATGTAVAAVTVTATFTATATVAAPGTAAATVTATRGDGDDAGVAGEATGRFRGNARAV